MINFFQVKKAYIWFLAEKKFFLQYLYELYFLKFFKFSRIFKLKETKFKTTLYPFSETFCSNMLLKIQAEKLLDIFANLCITTSHTLKFYFQEINLLDKTISKKLLKSTNFIKKRKTPQFFFENTITPFILNYAAELQDELYKKRTYFRFKKKENLEGLFFKFYRFLLKWITPIFELKIFQVYLMSLNLKMFKFANSSKYKENIFREFKNNVINFPSKSVLLIFSFLFLKSFSSRNLSLITINTFYYNNNLDHFARTARKNIPSLIEFLKQAYGKMSFFLNKKQNLFVLKVQKKFLRYETKLQEFPSKKLELPDLNFIYKEVKRFTKISSIMLINLETKAFSDFILTLNEFQSFFLKVLDTKELSLKISHSKRVKTQLFETYIFNKIMYSNCYLFKKLCLLPKFQKNNLNGLLKILNREISFTILKYNSKKFFQVIQMYQKKYNIVNFLEFLFLSTLTMTIKNYLFSKSYLSSLNQTLYAEKTKYEFLIIINHKFKILKILNLLKNIQIWFFYKDSFLNSKTDIYFYNFQIDEKQNLSIFNNSTKIPVIFKSSPNKDKKCIFIYKNSLILVLKFNNIIQLPIKWEQENYTIALKKMFKNYSNKNQNIVITNITEKIYVWVYHYRYIIVKHYFLELDRKLFQALWKWAIRRHNNKNKNWIKMKYFYQTTQKNLLFAMYIGHTKLLNELDPVPRFVYIPFHLQLFLTLKNTVKV